MDFQDLVDTPQKVKTIAGTVAFLVVFPVYFAAMPSLIDEDLVGGGSSGLVGTLNVSFEESEISLTETVVLGDGESHDTFFDLMAETEISVGYVELDVSCFDNDDPGPGFTDSVEGTSDLSDLDGLEDQTAEGQCSGGDGGFTIRWDLTENYTGEDYTEENESEGEIRERWNDGGLGRGTWAATITADISSPPAPVIGQIIDSDEEFDVTWTAVTFTVVIIST
tara:strand:- start:384 stop:1052 length:669 start_codon:yes stop_codon:yes gene_type:complete